MTGEAARDAFLNWLEQERHAAANTVEAYSHALTGFLGFLTNHLGGEPDLDALARLRAADIRGWLAALANEKLVASSRAQHLSAVRSFFRYLGRRHGVEITAVRLVSTARARPALPRALTIDQARDVTDHVGDVSDDPAIQARDIAFFSLLYGSGLRIAEALSLNVRDAIALRTSASLTVTGKGAKTRLVPVLPVVRAATEAWLVLHPQRETRQRPVPGCSRQAPRSSRRAEGASNLSPPGRAARTCHAARFATFLRHPPASQRQRPALDPGSAGACQPVHDPALHGGRRHRPPGRLAQNAPEKLNGIKGPPALCGSGQRPAVSATCWTARRK